MANKPIVKKPNPKQFDGVDDGKPFKKTKKKKK